MCNEGRRYGFTLIEALVAIAVVGVLLAGVVPAFVANLRINTDNEVRTGAVAAAQTVIDELRSDGAWAPYGNDADGNPTVPPEVEIESHGRTYQVELRYGPFCQGATCFAGARFVEVEVRHGGRTRYEVATVFTQLD